LHVQAQLSKPAHNIEEEGIREMAPSSSEISFPAEHGNMRKHHAQQH
jgi:hypothetical protein